MSPLTLIVALAALGGAVASQDPLFGFQPSTGITGHAAIDLDQADMETALQGPVDYEGAIKAFRQYVPRPARARARGATH